MRRVKPHIRSSASRCSDLRLLPRASLRWNRNPAMQQRERYEQAQETEHCLRAWPAGAYCAPRRCLAYQRGLQFGHTWCVWRAARGSGAAVVMSQSDASTTFGPNERRVTLGASNKPKGCAVARTSSGCSDLRLLPAQSSVGLRSCDAIGRAPMSKPSFVIEVIRKAADAVAGKYWPSA
jgi:hypothetical protein